MTVYWEKRDISVGGENGLCMYRKTPICCIWAGIISLGVCEQVVEFSKPAFS